MPAPIRRCFVSLLLVLFAGAVACNATADEPAGPLKGLLITGGCCHDYETQKTIITEGISQRVNITWDILHEGGDGRDHKVSAYSRDNWTKGYDIIVHNECFGGVADDTFVASIAAAHHEGVPAIFIHCALHSYRSAPVGADSWRELIGVTSRSHEGKRSVLVRKLNDDHPVMAGFPAKWQTPNGELYKIEKVWPNCIPLAEAYGEDTGRDHPVIWVNTFGRARVFGISLGHHNETMNTGEWLDVVSRGVLWATDHIRPDGSPMPGFEGSGVKPIRLETGPPEPKPDTAVPSRRQP